MKLNLLAPLLLASSATAFTVIPSTPSTSTTSSAVSPLFMGRAAVVRAISKGKTDARKSKANGTYGKKIIMCVKQGGPDPDSNRALGDLMRAAKANSVPIDNINRAIKKASEANTADFEERTFEAYGAGGASMVINVLSDNGNRSNNDVRTAVGKNNGKMAEQGSVLFMYDRKGKLEVPSAVDEEALMEAAIEADIDDYELISEEVEDGEISIIYVEPSDTNNMFEVLKGMGFEKGVKMELGYVTKAAVEVSNEDYEFNMKIIDALEDLDDVDSVEHNMSN
jgi:YebC/PmpR family DNA-binding regulatory protein